MKDPLSVVPLRNHGHFTEEGYEIVAKTIYNKINEIDKYNDKNKNSLNKIKINNKRNI